MTGAWRSYLPMIKLLGAGVVEQLFNRMADDATLVAELSKQLAEHEDPGVVWTKLEKKERHARAVQVQFVIRAIGRRLLS